MYISITVMNWNTSNRSSKYIKQKKKKKEKEKANPAQRILKLFFKLKKNSKTIQLVENFNTPHSESYRDGEDM